MDDSPLQEQLLKKIQELDITDANLKEEMAKLTCSGASSSIGVDSCGEIGVGHDETVPRWKNGSASSKHKDRSTLGFLNHRSSNFNFTDKQSFNILQSMGQAIHIYNDKGVIIYWNRGAEDVYGYSASEAIGHSVFGLIIEKHAIEDAKEIIHRSAIGESWTGLFPVIHKLGRRFRVVTTNSPFYDDYGTLVGFICVTCDSQFFHENHTTCTSRSKPSKKAAATGLQQKPFQATIPYKLFTLISGMTKSVLRWITGAKTMKYEIQSGNKPPVFRQGFLETIISDPIEYYVQEKMYQDESKIGVCKMITYEAVGVYYPWEGGAGDASKKMTTIYPSRELKDDFRPKKSQPLTNKVVVESCSSSFSNGNSTSSTVISGSCSSKNIEADFLSYGIPWGDLILSEQIGRGSCATVYHGLWCGSDVAVKIFSEFEYSEDLLRTFRHEVSLMKRLRHPNVLLFMGAVTSPKHLCIVTEFLPRGNLFQLLRRNPPALGWKRRVLMALDIVSNDLQTTDLLKQLPRARGLNYLHCYNPPIVHRDLKSSNLLIDNNWKLKVGDFGLSRLKHATFLTTKSGKGTPQWMAPEVIRNEPADEKSDVYSFGVVLWELATGKIPWDGLIPLQVVAAVGFMDQGIEIPNNIDPQWASLIKTCLHSDPKRRPTFGKLLEKLNVLWRHYFARKAK